MVDGFAAGVAYFREGFQLIRKPGIRLFVIIPVLINILVFSAFIYYFGTQFSGWVDSSVAWLPDWLDFLAWVLWLIFGLLIVFILVYGFVMVANIIGAPFYGLLSEQVEKVLTGKAPESELNGRELLMLLPRTLLREMQKLIYYLPRILCIFILGFVPLIQAVAPVVSGLFAAWMMSIQYVDYPADNHRVSFSRMRRLMMHRRATCGSFGGCVFLATLIPVVNLFVMPAAVAGGTAMWLRELRPILDAVQQK